MKELYTLYDNYLCSEGIKLACEIVYLMLVLLSLPKGTQVSYYNYHNQK